MTDMAESTPQEEHQVNDVSNDASNENTLQPIEEVTDYNSCSLDELIEKCQELSQTEHVYSVAKEIEAVKSVFYKKLLLNKAEKKAAFLEAGGDESIYNHQHPLEDVFKSIYSAFKKRKADFRAQQEKDFVKNLKLKRLIIEEINSLTKGSETIKDTFDHFHKLQEKWRNTGAVAAAQNNNLWQSYHHHVELFYDYISINRELRDLDFKRNLEKKTALCEKAEGLAEEKSLNKAHQILQELHEVWKELGPVSREHRETIWDRFKEATRVLHKKRNDYFVELKEKSAQTAKEKEAICQQIIESYSELPTTHNHWKSSTEKVLKLEESWKNLGRLERSDNTKAWKRLRAVLGDFYHAKNEFYKIRKEDLKSELNKKITICEKAESLMNSSDWKTTSEQLIKLQKEWKDSGYVPKNQSEPIWKRFRAACDTFFDRRKAHFKEADTAREQSLKSKKALLTKTKKTKLSNDTDSDFKMLQQLFQDWNSLGQVPRDKSNIEKEFKTLLDGLYDQLKLDKKELEKIKFENKIKNLKTDTFKLDKERQFIRGKMNDLQKQIIQYETNIEFFGRSKGAEKLRQQVAQKIEDSRQLLGGLKEKLSLLNKL